MGLETGNFRGAAFIKLRQVAPIRAGQLLPRRRVRRRPHGETRGGGRRHQMLPGGLRAGLRGGRGFPYRGYPSDSVPAGYRRQVSPRRPKLEPFTGIIDTILENDLRLLRKQRHTAQHIFQPLTDEHCFGVRYTIVKDNVGSTAIRRSPGGCGQCSGGAGSCLRLSRV